MSIKIAINGFGRIGRPTFKRLISHHTDLEVVAINDLTDNPTLAHLLKYDSVYGTYDQEIGADEKGITVAGKKYQVLAEKDPAQLPWQKMGVDIVLECTGFFTDLEGATKHLTAGAKRVIISAPSKSEKIPTYLLGVNAEKYQEEKIIDMGSCTTNCVAPIVKVLNDEFGISKAFLTTIHAYTSTQKLVDGPHKDLRRARAAALNIVPTTTGAAISVIKALPELAGKLDGIAMRVPLPVVSVSDIVAFLDKQASVEKVNQAFKKYSQEQMKNILTVSDEPLVSSDYQANPYSAIVDLALTRVVDNGVKAIAWYDNEWGYACRLAEMADYIGSKLAK